MCCAQVRRSSIGINADIARVRCDDYFGSLAIESFKRNWGYSENMQQQGNAAALEDHPDLQGERWSWRRRLVRTQLAGSTTICCPEHVQCVRAHSDEQVCPDCMVPLCTTCRLISCKSGARDVGVPTALANDNFVGFPPEIIYKYKVRWVERVAASPRLHVFDRRLHRR